MSRELHLLGPPCIVLGDGQQVPVRGTKGEIDRLAAGYNAMLQRLRKSLDLQAQSAQQLIAALPQPAANNPPHLGNTVNTFA